MSVDKADFCLVESEAIPLIVTVIGEFNGLNGTSNIVVSIKVNPGFELCGSDLQLIKGLLLREETFIIETALDDFVCIASRKNGVVVTVPAVFSFVPLLLTLSNNQGFIGGEIKAVAVGIFEEDDNIIPGAGT